MRIRANTNYEGDIPQKMKQDMAELNVDLDKDDEDGAALFQLTVKHVGDLIGASEYDLTMGMMLCWALTEKDPEFSLALGRAVRESLGKSMDGNGSNSEELFGILDAFAATFRGAMRVE